MMSQISSSPDDPVTSYAKAVVEGGIVAGPYVKLSCQRHLRDLEFGAALGLRFDPLEVATVVNFFRTVLTIETEEKQPDGSVEGKVVPFILQPWQVFIVGSLFGWKNSEGLRRFRRAYVESAKGSGKSPLASGIGMYFLAGKGVVKERGEIYSAATSRDQAFILFRDAIAMWRRSRNLRRRITTKGKQTQTISQLTHIGTDSIFRPVSTENKGQSGLRPYCALIDEVHEHADNTVIEMMRAGTKGNQEALIFEITNAGFDKRTVCGQEHDYSVKVVNGEEDNDAWFTYICALDPGDEPFEDESCWIKANPNLGVSIHPAYIREQVQEAKGLPSKEGTVRRLNFCQWTESESSAIPRATWVACEGEVDPEALTKAGYECHGGLDLSRTKDLTAFTLTWLLDATKDQWRFSSKTWFWTPKDTLHERSKTDRVPYEVWVDQGFMEAVPGKRISYPWIADALAKLCEKYSPVDIGCDQYGLEAGAPCR
jgi:phage terminase large subunit-like protein